MSFSPCYQASLPAVWRVCILSRQLLRVCFHGKTLAFLALFAQWGPLLSISPCPMFRPAQTLSSSSAGSDPCDASFRFHEVGWSENTTYSLPFSHPLGRSDTVFFSQMIWPREFNRVGHLSGPVPSLLMSLIGFAAMLKLAFITYATASRAERCQVPPLVLSGNLFLCIRCFHI